MATTRTATAARPVAKSKGGVARTRLTHREAAANLAAGLAIELLVWSEGEEEAGPTSYWLALEADAYRLVKVTDEEGATVYRLLKGRVGPATCNCPDGRYRGASRACRHVRLVGNVLAKLSAAAE